MTEHLTIGPRKRVDSEELLDIKLLLLRDILEEACVAAILLVLCKEESADIRLLDEHLARP